MILGRVLVTRNRHLGTTLHLTEHLGNLGSQGISRVEIVAIKLDIHRRLTGHTAATTLGHGKGTNLRVLAKNLTHTVANLDQRQVTFGLLHERNIHRNKVRTVILQRSKYVVRVGLTLADVDHRHLLGIGCADTLHQLQSQIARNLLTRTCRQLNLGTDTCAILHGEELRLHTRSQQTQHSHKEDERTTQHTLAVRHTEGQHATIEVVETLHHGINLTLEPCLLRTLLHHQGAEYRRKGDGRNGRNGQRNGHHPTHRVEEDTGHTRHHRQRQEHGNRRQRTTHYRDTYLLRSEDGGLLGLGSAVDVGRNILQHHNGVIDHHTDSNRERRHGDNVQRLARSQDVNHGSQKRNRNRQHDDNRCTPATQEEEYHNHHEQQGRDNRIAQRIDGRDNIIRRIDNGKHLHVRRQVLLNRSKMLLYRGCNLHGIGTRLLLDDNHTTLLAVVVGILDTLLHRVIDGSHIAQANRRTVAIAHHKAQHLARVLELVVHTQRIGIRTEVERTGRRIAVSRSNGRRDSLNREAVSLQLVRVAIDLNLALGNTGNRNRTHTAHTCQRRCHLVVENLVQTAHALLGRHTHHQDGNHVGRKLEDDGLTHTIG